MCNNWRKKSFKFNLFVWITIIILCSCTHTLKSKVELPADFDPDLPINHYEIEIEKQQRIILNEKDKEKLAETYFKLAQLHISYKNPKRNYQKSYECLKETLRLNKTSQKKYDVQNLMVLLNDIKNLHQINRTNERNLEKSRHDNIRLIKENVELKLFIESIKKMDLEIEMKRKIYR